MSYCVFHLSNSTCTVAVAHSCSPPITTNLSLSSSAAASAAAPAAAASAAPVSP
eukprot:CAMPEP_0175144010 /NCGR_PEP_ID=MMETSP0087-20121206/13845_1 /TAXON_ID=136419 /ORGANISM="Unknown Unknown, Strain D1" /LENGTH=53 /DNA_ID=CAMNT_0016428333 /DNA_START=345 /DNA_END=502 /DNA_ORIENTATION=-